jgi:hypothetical protein
MKLPENIRKCVAFVGLRLPDQRFSLLGTCFFIVRDDKPNGYSYVVTAKHIIEEIKNKELDEVYIRFNLTTGGANWVQTNLKYWFFHNDKNCDVAILPFGFPDNYDHLFYPLSRALTKNVIKEHEIGIGEEVFIVGLFSHHHGTQKNIPIARVGNISAMPDEKIQTRQHLMDAYLIEVRSIGGLSGSPVFVNLGSVRIINGELKQSKTGFQTILPVLSI